jgi:predicted Rossmann fold nucleotide-binding protein DprA/Smf involved in DNA uptake
LESTLTPDTQTVLLLCGELGQRSSNGPKPLGLRQYNNLASWLRTQGLRPGDLLTSEGQAKLEELRTAELNPNRVAPLLERGVALALIVERWERSGLWVISRSDPKYPERLKRYLAQGAPPLLYGVGSKDLLNRGGLTVVGSRDRSEEDGEFARRVGESCAKEDITIITGAAKGIDRDAISGALDAGGWALGVLAEGLAKTATSGQYRAGLVSDHLTLISPYDPDSRWFAHLAMERNKLLYGLSNAALVVASAADSGGTWAGATEALDHGKVRVFVKTVGVVAPGNTKLLRMGAIPFPSEPWENIRSLFTPPLEKNQGLFATPVPWVDAAADRIAEQSESSAPVAELPQAEEIVADPSPLSEGLASSPEPLLVPGEEPVCDAYQLVIDAMLVLLNEPRTDEWLAEKMSVRAAQIKDWLARGVHEGRIQKMKKPARYVAHKPTLFKG